MAVGPRGTCVTPIERKLRFVLIVKVANKRIENVVAVVIRAVGQLPVALRRSLTRGRVTELTDQAQFTVAAYV